MNYITVNQKDCPITGLEENEFGGTFIGLDYKLHEITGLNGRSIEILMAEEIDIELWKYYYSYTDILGLQ